MSELHYLSATEAVRMFTAGELSPVELMTAVIRRAEAVEPQINAFPATLYESALEQAREAEKRYAAGDARPLEGIPVAVKEEAPIAGQPNTLGSLRLRDHVADKTAVFVQRIIDAGGIVHARSATPEFSSAPVTWSALWGVTRNPWNLAYSPGGSSGGSGAALAAGSDDAGDRVGHRRFDPHPVLVLRCRRLQAAVRTRARGRDLQPRPLLPRGSARAHRRRLRAARERHRRPASQRRRVDPAEARDPVGRWNRSRGLRIAFSPDLGCFDVAPDVVASAEQAAERLRAAGAAVDRVSLPWDLEAIKRASRIHLGTIMAGSIAAEFGELDDDFTSYVRGLVAEAESLTKHDIVEGLALEAVIYEPLGTLLDDYDALLCPTFAVAGLPAQWQLSEPAARPVRRRLARRDDDPAVQHREPLPGASTCRRACRRTACRSGCRSSGAPTTTSRRSGSRRHTSSSSAGGPRAARGRHCERSWRGRPRSATASSRWPTGRTRRTTGGRSSTCAS